MSKLEDQLQAREDDFLRQLFHICTQEQDFERFQELVSQKLSRDMAGLQAKTLELQRLVNSISGGLEICDLNDGYPIRYVSDGFVKLVGFTREELIGNAHAELIHPADAALAFGQIVRQLEADGAFSVAYRIVRKDKEVRWILDNGSVFEDPNGRKQVSCFLTDITDQKLQEEELRVSQKRYEVALQQMDLSMFEYNIDTKQLFLYEKDASLYGVTQVIEDGPRVLAESGHFDSECVPGYLEMYRKIISGEQTYASCLMTTHDVDGKYHEFELSLTAVLDQDGKPIRAIGVKKNSAHLRRLQREQQFSKTMAGGRSFICEADITNDYILRFDPQWRQLLNAQEVNSYSQLLATATECYGIKEHQTYLLERFAANRLAVILEYGRDFEQFTYQKAVHGSGELVWNEITIHIIRDEASGNVCVRVYHEDISQRKRKEDKAKEEQRLYESMASNAIEAYEFNLSRDLTVRGHEDWRERYGVECDNCYSSMMEDYVRHEMLPSDGVQFKEIFNRQNLLAAYASGEREISGQYRKRVGKEDYIWAECTAHLFEDPQSGDIRCYSYVENIDKQKRAELELRYKAEHDAHTNLYNKETTAVLIGQYLESAEGKRGIHAFFMVDMDHFKNINDSFGHLFGDSVIAEMGARIRSLFRDDDIVGRIGGDEFCVLMKQVPSQAAVGERADRLCDALNQSYCKDGCVCTISASVGVALYPIMGRNFEELYRHADTALYVAKRNGRNRYAMSDEN